MESPKSVDIDAECYKERSVEKMGCVELPECRPLSEIDKEYMTCPEEQIWSAREDEDDAWINRYVVLGRSTLTLAQETQLNIPKEEAMENACTGLAEQYIMDALYKAEYVPEVALHSILKNDIPSTIVRRWTAFETELFHQGLTRHGTNFSKIQKDFLPGKDMAEIVEFYYTWKGSVPTTQVRKGRHREYLKTRRQSIKGTVDLLNVQSSRIMTRSSSLARRNSKTPPRRDVSAKSEKVNAISTKENIDPQLNVCQTNRPAKRRRTLCSPVEKVKEENNNAVATTEE